jgi:hypothetical protein
MATSSQTAKEEPTMSTMIIRGGTETAEQTEVLFDQITRWVEAMGREVDDLYALAKALVKNGDGWNISAGIPVEGAHGNALIREALNAHTIGRRL